MRTGRHLKPPLYVLPHGIEVIGEYAPTKSNPYWRVRIRPHPFFPTVRIVSNGLYVRRSRVILASKLGRALNRDEIAHHRDEDKNHDAPDNIERTSSQDHNRHHKSGSTHTNDVRRRISASLRASYQEDRRARPQITHRDQQGRIAKP